MVVKGYQPDSPDNKSIKEQLEELKKLNVSTAYYSKVIIWISVSTLMLTLAGVIIALIKKQ